MTERDFLILVVSSIGGLNLVLSIIYFIVPPKKINNWYGYRTQQSMSSLEHWKKANQLASKGMVLIALLQLLILIVSLIVFEEFMVHYFPLILILVLIVPYLLLLIYVEHELKAKP